MNFRSSEKPEKPLAPHSLLSHDCCFTKRHVKLDADLGEAVSDEIQNEVFFRHEFSGERLK